MSDQSLIALLASYNSEIEELRYTNKCLTSELNALNKEKINEWTKFYKVYAVAYEILEYISDSEFTKRELERLAEKMIDIVES